jgi:hypothetical protein
MSSRIRLSKVRLRHLILRRKISRLRSISIDKL